MRQTACYQGLGGTAMTCDLNDSHAVKAEYRHDQMLTSAFISMVHCVFNQFVALSSTESCQTY